MYFDSHAHLTEGCFAQDFGTIVENMKAASVTGMMEIGYRSAVVGKGGAVGRAI